MILVWILLVVGFVLLIKGADYFVEGSSAVAKILENPQYCDWPYDCGYGNQRARTGSQCDGCIDREQ